MYTNRNHNTLCSIVVKELWLEDKDKDLILKDKENDLRSEDKDKVKDLRSKDKDKDLKIGPRGSSRTRTFLEDYYYNTDVIFYPLLRNLRGWICTKSDARIRVVNIINCDKFYCIESRFLDCQC